MKTKTGVIVELTTDDVDGGEYRRLAIILKRLGRDHGWRCRDIRAMADAPGKGHQHAPDAMQGIGPDDDITGAPDAPEARATDLTADGSI